MLPFNPKIIDCFAKVGNAWLSDSFSANGSGLAWPLLSDSNAAVKNLEENRGGLKDVHATSKLDLCRFVGSSERSVAG